MAKLVGSWLIGFTLLMMMVFVTSWTTEDTNEASQAAGSNARELGEDGSWSEWAKSKLAGGEKAISNAVNYVADRSEVAEDKVKDTATKAEEKVEDAAASDTRRHANEIADKAAKKKGGAIHSAKSAYKAAKQKASESSESAKGATTETTSANHQTASITVESTPEL